MSLTTSRFDVAESFQVFRSYLGANQSDYTGQYNHPSQSVGVDSTWIGTEYDDSLLSNSAPPAPQGSSAEQSYTVIDSNTLHLNNY